jgi:E3 ubiquitin-protein ligase MARCH6
MPQRLPPGIFFRHFVLHAIRNIGIWLRFCLVAAVWLGCLPYVIRQVWRLLFWFSDGGWPSRFSMLDARRNATAMMELAEQLKEASSYVAANGTSPVSPLNAAQTTPAAYEGFWKFIMPFSETLNFSDADPLAVGLYKALYYGLGISPTVVSSPDSPSNASNLTMPTAPVPKSLLSEVPYLSNMTRHAYLNQIVVTISEGYIITILVVVSFILVFLIREWVVQQQPGINMGAGFNAEFPAPDRRERELAAIEEAPADQDPGDIAQRPMARPRRRNVHFEGAENGHQAAAVAPEPREIGESGTDTIGTAADVAEMQKQLSEAPRLTAEFMAIWKRANSDPKEVLRIIEEEQLSNEMQYWVKAMKTLQSHPELFPPLPNQSLDPAPRPSSSESSGAESAAAQAGSSTSSESWVDVMKLKNEVVQASQSQSPELSNENGKGKAVDEPLFEPEVDQLSGIDLGVREKSLWESLPATPPPASPDLSLEKGKGKDISEPIFQPVAEKLPEINWDDREIPWNSPPSAQFHFGASNSRPRAVSDGPPLKENIALSPLAKNSWTFDGSDVFVDTERNPSEFKGKAKALEAAKDLRMLDINGVPVRPPKPVTEEMMQVYDKFWKDSQDLRVREAIEKGREAQKSAAEQLAPDSSVNNVPLDDQGAVDVLGQDGRTRTYDSWQEVFDANPYAGVDDSESEMEEDHEPEPNPFAPDAPLPEPREPVVVRPAEPQGILGNVADWLWGGAEDEGADDEHVVENLAAEAPFIPIAHEDPFEQREFAGQDREVVEAAIAAGIDPNDPDAMDDQEDFEGIMELIGMRGAIFSLVQNALFSAFLLALTVAFGVWIPYNIGRVTLLLVTNPGPTFKLPLRLMFWCAGFVQDILATVFGLVSYFALTLLSIPLKIWYQGAPSEKSTWGESALRLTSSAVSRILDGTVNSFVSLQDSDMPTFSAASHESLLLIQSLVTDTFETIGRTVVYLFVGDYNLTLASTWSLLVGALVGAWHFIATLPSFLANSWVINLEVAKRATPLDPQLSIWGGWDRFWATIAGYTALCFIGAMYVKKGSPFSTGQVGREWEATIIDFLHQAGGVMKVILIISIEMLVFPLYCGLLLDAALLPLFDSATIMSRVLFTFNSPCTSMFVHWFVGTCYMFHFALFVSMCRKIMRKGVLCECLGPLLKCLLTFVDFIRDPDDPTFHPVRDVLERNVATQLRKILFSALVYGALVVVCLGGVVWGLAYAFNGVLPIHWSSNEPVLEFPIDLLFYNFLMPLAVRFFKPSDGLHAMYSWWFRQCARMLRLTWFMFDERRLDEEGRSVRRSWRDVFHGVKADPHRMVKTDDSTQYFAEHPDMDAYFRQDGRYVRAPASDQVRIPKGSRVFLEVDEFNNRLDKKWDRPDGVHGKDNELYKQVYIPPYFRLRICAFIVSIWLFAALTGVCITIVPLVFGREVFSRVIPSDVRKNDVYAFSIGIYILGSALYCVLHARHFMNYLVSSFALTHETPNNVYRHVTAIATRVAKLAWVYGAFIFILPTLFALVIEFYAILPMHTYFSPDEPHTIHFVQSWTLGLLYLKLTSRVILYYSDSRPAISLRAITRDGYLNPDAKLATRSFILPFSMVLGTALFWPWCLARIILLTAFQEISHEQEVMVYRYVYPAVLAMAAFCWIGYLAVGMVRGWKSRIRDEVYLIGERLHNFGERKAGSAHSGAGGGGGVVRRIGTEN